MKISQYNVTLARVPNLLVRLWDAFYYKDINNVIGYFMKVDSTTFDTNHSTFAYILVDIDISKTLIDAEPQARCGIGSSTQTSNQGP